MLTLAHILKSLLTFVVLLGMLSPMGLAHAQQNEFVPLVQESPLPSNPEDPSSFFNSLFRIGIGIAAILAVLMIILGGFQYMTSDVPGAKSDGKTRIWGAIIGLLVILLSALILSIINPDILSFELFN